MPTLQHGSGAEVIARQLRTDIHAGRWHHEQQLPSTRALAEQWHTSVATINRAMALLADEGLVINRARSSRIVNYPEDTSTRGRPTVLIIGGYAGSGKTELGRIVARHTGWPILDKDSTTRAVVEAALQQLGRLPSDRESEVYRSVIRPAEYEALRTATMENVDCGNSVAMTAPFITELGDPAWCSRITTDVEAMHAQLRTVWVRCDLDSMHTYLQRRGAARDTWKLAHWQEYAAGLDLAFEPAMPHDIVENSLTSEPLRRQARRLTNELVTLP